MIISDVDTIEVEQAVFASSDRGRMKGYQLVSKSAGVDRELSQELCRWAPTQMLSNDPEDWTINYFPVTPTYGAVTRTVLGGPEYSRRGASQVVTLILLLRDTQFECYDWNAVAVAKTALAMGHLRLPMTADQEVLSCVTLPRSPILESSSATHRDSHEPSLAGLAPTFNQLLDETTQLLRQSRRVAVLGVANPLDAVDQLVKRIPVSCRKEFSFTTGLSPSVRRPFQAHFLSSVDVPLQKTLSSQNIAVVGAH